MLRLAISARQKSSPASKSSSQSWGARVIPREMAPASGEVSEPASRRMLVAPTRWAEVTQWAGCVRTAAEPWNSDAGCNKEVTNGGLAVNGRVYQEAYDNHWSSYLASARKQRVSMYQFKWTGEWFSELYAAYKTDSMNAGHPARTWLDKLSGKGKVR